jgi:hypothetical protein
MIENVSRALELMRSSAPGAQTVEPVRRKYGDKDLLINPKSGGLVADLTPPSTAKLPAGMEAIGATEDENGRIQIRYGFPKAEGKALTAEEVSRIASLNQAEKDLDTLDSLFKEVGKNYGGPVSGRVKSGMMAGQNPNIASLENAITAATPNLARGVFREVGVLTDQDIARYQKLLPGPYDTDEVRKRKMGQLRTRLAEGRKETLKSLKSAGRNVEGFADQSTPAAPQRFDSEQAARAAGAQTGDVIELYDPGTGTYRKARLK